VLSAELERSLVAQMDIRLGTRIVGVRLAAGGVEMALTEHGAPTRLVVDRILFALGRAPSVEHLGLERAGVDVFAGTPLVDRHRRTSNPCILLAGDDSFDGSRTSLGGRQSEIAGHNAARPDHPQAVPESPPMKVVLTDPPYARVGITEVAARAREGELFAASRTYADEGLSARSWLGAPGVSRTSAPRRGVVRMWTDRRGRILGGEALGPSADLLAHLIMYAMHFGGTVEDVWRTEQPHPSLAQTVWALADSLCREAGVSVPRALGAQAVGVVSLTPPFSAASSAGTCSP
jgi:pyruvate/2-oxoglutarate dehydrogenase complex dihydrolipoamide dehydrogenase (E3) component